MVSSTGLAEFGGLATSPVQALNAYREPVPLATVASAVSLTFEPSSNQSPSDAPAVWLTPTAAGSVARLSWYWIPYLAVTERAWFIVSSTGLAEFGGLATSPVQALKA